MFTAEAGMVSSNRSECQIVLLRYWTLCKRLCKVDYVANASEAMAISNPLWNSCRSRNMKISSVSLVFWKLKFWDSHKCDSMIAIFLFHLYRLTVPWTFFEIFCTSKGFWFSDSLIQAHAESPNMVEWGKFEHHFYIFTFWCALVVSCTRKIRFKICLGESFRLNEQLH
jgi:hypothetical protein